MKCSKRSHLPVFCLIVSVCVACNEAPIDDGDYSDAMTNTADTQTIGGSVDLGTAQPSDSQLQDNEVNRADQALDSGETSVPDVDASALPDQSIASGLTCEITNHCPEPEVCNDGLCDPSTVCASDSDCEIGYLCNRGRFRCVKACRVQAGCPQEQVCINQKCTDGTRCSSDRNCEVGQVCETDSTGGFCTDSVPDMLGDMGIAPDGGIWTCNDTLCQPRQRCGPHPSTNCEVTDCLSGHGGNCDANCDCASGLICKQNTQTCVSCLNGLQCDSPERCISTGQCGLTIELDGNQPSELSVLQTLVQCQVNLDNEACAQFTISVGAPNGTQPDLPRLKALGCDNALYASAMQDQEPIQDLLRCGGSQSPLIIDPSYDPMGSTVCVTQRSGYFIFHGCNPDQVPIQ